MTYIPTGLTEEQERFIEYELPKARFEHEKRMAKWDILDALGTSMLPILAFFGVTAWAANRKRK
jgi:hypothetical protein